MLQTKKRRVIRFETVCGRNIRNSYTKSIPKRFQSISQSLWTGMADGLESADYLASRVIEQALAQ
jgi:hypothetical protein